MRQISHALADAPVLIADPCPHFRRAMRGALRARGLRFVLEAPDGIAALTVAAAARARVVVLDWALPLIEGSHAARLLRDPESSHDPMVAIIALSAAPTVAMVRGAADLAVDHVLLKPVSPRDLWRRVEHSLSLGNHAQGNHGQGNHARGNGHAPARENGKEYRAASAGVVASWEVA